MNSDLTPTNNVLNTDNPQGVGSPGGASKASDFQQAAGPEVLTQNHSLNVASNGTRITHTQSPSSVDAGTYVIIIIGTIIFLLITKGLFKWVQSAPDVPKPDPALPVIASKPTAAKKPKKKSRAKRRQAK